MRVVVTIEDGEGAVSAPPAALPMEVPQGQPAGPAARPPTTEGPPPDLAARAQAEGAISAGPAPSMPALGGAPPFVPTQPGTPGTPVAGPDASSATADLPAGAAPGFSDQPGIQVEMGTTSE